MVRPLRILAAPFVICDALLYVTRPMHQPITKRLAAVFTRCCARDNSHMSPNYINKVSLRIGRGYGKSLVVAAAVGTIGRRCSMVKMATAHRAVLPSESGT